jgi:hypothetical protein
MVSLPRREKPARTGPTRLLPAPKRLLPCKRAGCSPPGPATRAAKGASFGHFFGSISVSGTSASQAEATDDEEERKPKANEATPEPAAQPSGATPTSGADANASQAQPEPASPGGSGDAGAEIIGVPPFVWTPEPEDVRMEGGCDGLHLHGVTHGDYSSNPRVENQKLVKAEGCECAQGVQCIHLTGVLVVDYKAKVTIDMPSVPAGLTPCEQGKVRDFLKNVLRPHEEDHKKRMETYIGRTSRPIDLTGCGTDDLLSQAKAMAQAEDTTRKAAANALSGAIDPFDKTVDCSACPDAPEAGAGPHTAPDAGK